MASLVTTSEGTPKNGIALCRSTAVNGSMNSRIRLLVAACVLVPLASTLSQAQGTLQDYQRAQQFLPGNLRHIVYLADVNPHWIEKTSRFWYRKSSPGGSEFILVRAEHNTSAPAFDHTRLAEALSHSAKQEYSASDLPFREFEFVDDGKGIRFSIDNTEWSCSIVN